MYMVSYNDIRSSSSGVIGYKVFKSLTSEEETK